MGVDSEPPISLDAAATLSFRCEHGLGKALVAFVGANTYDKGAFALTRAVIQLNLSGLSTDLVCVGPQDETLQVFLQRLSPEENGPARGHVHVWGTVDEECKHRLLGACDVFALPSQVDTFGIVFLEAWLHGKPVIGANAGGIPDLVHHEENGLLVPFGEVDALATAIRRLLAEPVLATRLGAAGRQMVLQRYTWRQTYQTLMEVCGEVITEHRKASLADGHAPAA
jgi:glycosyltransferase involved in cell wall biosynthesis